MEGHTDCPTARLVPDAPDSVHKVLCTLEDHEPMTNKQLQEETGLPRRTLYSALRRLENEGLLKHRISLRDTRQTYWFLDEESTAALAA